MASAYQLALLGTGRPPEIHCTPEVTGRACSQVEVRECPDPPVPYWLYGIGGVRECPDLPVPYWLYGSREYL